MGALFDYLSVFEDVDAVGILDGGETVGDDEGGACGHEVVERVLDELFGLGVHTGGGFIEDEDGLVLE